MPKLNTKSNRLTLLFVLIFLVGVLGFVAYINNVLNKNHNVESSQSTTEFPLSD